MSDRPKWTPGPWTYYRDRERSQVDCAGGTICSHVDWAPNGPLIAAAPALYRELEASATALLPDGTPCWCYIGPIRFAPERHDALCARRRAALAKARGE